MLYEQVKKDIFSANSTNHHHSNNNTELSLSHHHESIQAPSVTTIVLLQVQASMVQVISKLRSENKKPIRNMVKLPLRWGFLVGLLVVDNVARVLHVDQEMAYIQQLNEKNHQDASSTTTSDDDDTPIDDNESLDNHRHTQFIIPTKSKSSTIPLSSSYQQRNLYPMKSSSSDLLSKSPHLAPPPLPVLLKSSNGLRVRSRKTSSPAALLTQSSATVPTTPTTLHNNPSSQRQSYVRQRSISNNIHDGSNRIKQQQTDLNNKMKQQTVRRVNTQRELKIISPSVSSSTSSNVIRRQTSFNNLNDKKVKRSPSYSKKSKS
ncbi:unnamed protein product [Cunninghamella blakesleeana]